MEIVKVPGKNNKNKVFIYALSTCAWCKMTKQFLKEHDVEFEYVDVDHCTEEDLKKVKKDILEKGGSLSYPTIIIDYRGSSQTSRSRRENVRLSS
jgi:glutaredoxin